MNWCDFDAPDVVGFSRMSGRPSRLFQVVTPSSGPG